MGQICKLIPEHLVGKLAREHGVDKRARDFTPWSHVVTMLYTHVAHSLSLNDVCDSLRMQKSSLAAIRGAVPPSRNALSHANRQRSAGLAEALLWALLKHLTEVSPKFARSTQGKNWAHRFRRPIQLIDATTIQLVANCMDWAKHRQRKAAAKCHLRLDLHSWLPKFVAIETGAEHEVRRAREACAGLQAGEIAVFDKGYIDFQHLYQMHQRGIFWVSRAKESLGCMVLAAHSPPGGKILRDEVIALKYFNSKRDLPIHLRRVVALVEVNGQEREMAFLTNNFTWSAQSIADLYRCRWSIEVFFKYIKQTLQLADFLGYSANAVRWQVWTGLIVFLLMRYLAWQAKWNGHFVRLFTIARAALWRKWEMLDLLRHYGTATPLRRWRAQPEQAYFPGFA